MNDTANYPGAPWMRHAACGPGHGVNPEIFFPEHLRRVAGQPAEQRLSPPGPGQAQAVCAGCPVKSECLDYALDYGMIGVWGGLTTQQRKDKFGRHPNHGTLRRYHIGCRCPSCVASHDLDYELRRERRAGKLPCPPRRHGTETGWNAYSCRCIPCVAAHDVTIAAARRASRAR